MPINEDGAFQSYRFQYTHEQDEQFVLNVEYHQTEIGATVTIHNLLDQPLSLPLSLYVDVVDHLRSRGAITGGVAKPLAGYAGTTLRPTNKLMPTRMASSPAYEPTIKHVAPQPPPAAPTTLHEAQQVQNTYMAQHAVLQAENVTEPQQMRTVAAPRRKLVEPDNRPDPTQEFDGSLSLAAGQAKRAAAGVGNNNFSDGKRSFKRIVKPGEAGFLDPPQG